MGEEWEGSLVFRGEWACRHAASTAGSGTPKRVCDRNTFGYSTVRHCPIHVEMGKCANLRSETVSWHTSGNPVKITEDQHYM
jgi:hypothetical protein